MIWLLAAAVAAAPPVPCATPQTWADVVDPAPALPPPPDGLGERDAFGVPNVQTSAHFALRWGNADPPDQASRDRLLDAFELGWDVQLEQMGHTRPYGTGEYYFNVYVGDSGSGAPPGAGAGGYYTTDIRTT